MMRQGGSTSLFQASQQWSTRSSYDLKLRFESQLSRMNCHTFSTGLSSGHLGGSAMMVMLAGTTRRVDMCQPAWSTKRTAWAAGATAAAISASCRFIASVSRGVSLDHLVGAREQRGGHVEAERSGGRQINDEIELGRL